MDKDTIDAIFKSGREDQAHAALTEMADRLILYYHQMARGGIPRSLARLLVCDYQRLALYKAYWPNDPPTLGPALSDDE